MRPEICGKKDRGEHEAGAEKVPVASALDPRFKLMEPVDVTTLGRRTPDGGVKAVAEDATPDAAAPAKPAKKKKVVKKKPAKPDTPVGDAAVEPTLVDGGQGPAKAATKSSTLPKIEVGVPFDSTDIAPLPDMPAPAAP